MPRGGARPNTGPKKGSKHAATISKEQAREALRAVVQQHMGRMVSAQVANAVGIMHLMLRNSDGTWRKATKADEIEKALNGDPNLYWIATKDPNVQAFSDLMNRALDKPKEQEATINLTGEVTLVNRLLAGRKRAAEGQ